MNPLVRSFDILVSLISIILFLPILLLIPVLIKLDDGGPVFFFQKRLGINKKTIIVWKFRTMKNGKITRVGKWLRATALDEFLQLLLIVRGQMSLVGPRPLTQDDVTRLGWDHPEYLSRWKVIPGVTGLVQIYGGTSAIHSWELEKYYLRHQTFKLQLQIILLSGIVTIVGKKRTKSWLPFRPQLTT